MSSEQVLIDFALPNTPDTLKFLKLSQSDKIKAIALGIKFLTSGNHQMQSWDNSQWENRLEQIQQEKQEIILELEFSLKIKQSETLLTTSPQLNAATSLVFNL